ncbi:MAG: 50S ribosomal protein L29 [Chitinophagaceae bacterium]|nr:MAG: 50S ribosomal protein L29 [Chitinophagaceae bacterium]
MAKKKFDFAELTTQELHEKLIDDKVRLSKMKFNHTVSPLDNPMEIKFLRRDIARIYSELNKRETETTAS